MTKLFVKDLRDIPLVARSHQTSNHAALCFPSSATHFVHGLTSSSSTLNTTRVGYGTDWITDDHISRWDTYCEGWQC